MVRLFYLLDAEISLLLNRLNEFFTCLKEDDGKEPYICDKIINIPIVLDKKIKDVNYILSIMNSGAEYIDGTVIFNKEGNTDFTSIDYGAEGYYKKIAWSKRLDSNIQYMRENNENFYGIKDNGNVQIMTVQNYSDDEIKNLDELNEFIHEYLVSR